VAKNNFRIDILGTSLVIAADDEISYLEEIMHRFQTAVNNTRKMTGLEDNLKLAVVTGFLLCDEISKVRAQTDNLFSDESAEAEHITQQLIERLNAALPGV
jgi:cell division protein ZapA (FtsZ GTPase activity inhibitor)